jgi:hypothetical protein
MAACLVQNGLLSEPLDPFSDPTQQKVAVDKARQLLRSILPENTWTELEEKGFIQFAGKRGTYLISPYTQTEIRETASGRCVAYACLQLSIPAPTYDRMIAEYLLIRNAENVYWKTANIFCPRGNEFGFAASLFFIVFDIALFVHILLKAVAVQ